MQLSGSQNRWSNALACFGSRRASLVPPAPCSPCGVWIIYDHPTDHPDKFVARKFYVGASMVLASDEVLGAETLEKLRPLLPTGLVNLGRADDETDETVVEMWA